jgi:hypothetical protein
MAMSSTSPSHPPEADAGGAPGEPDGDLAADQPGEKIVGLGTGVDLGDDLEALIAATLNDTVPTPDGTDMTLRKARLMHAAERWFMQTGRLPRPEDWAENDDWPDPMEVKELFGGFRRLIAESSLGNSPLVGPLQMLGPAIARLRANHAQGMRHRRRLEEQLAERGRALDRRERTMRQELVAEMDDRVIAARADLEAQLAELHTELQQAHRLSATEQSRAEKAEREAIKATEQSVTLRRLSAETEQDAQRARARACALLGTVSDDGGVDAAYRAWMEFGGGQFEKLVSAVAGSLASGECEHEITAAINEPIDLPWREGLVSARATERAAGRLMEIVQSEPLDAGLASLRRTSVTVWEARGRAGVLTEVRFLDAEPVLDRSLLEAIAERVMLVDRPLPDREWLIGTQATVVDAQGFDEFLAFLRDPGRARAVLALTGAGSASNAQRLAAQLCGAAHVIRLDREATSRMSQVVGSELGVWGGDVRCYRPGFGAHSPSAKHPRLVRGDGSERSAEEFDQLLVVLAAAPAELPESLEVARAIVHGNGSDDADSEYLSRERLEQRLHTVESENIALRRRQEEDRDSAQPAAPEQKGEHFQTVLEATERAQADAQHLRFAPRALKVAGESPFRRPQEIYERLMILDRLAAEYCAGGLGVRLGERALALGLNWRSGISVTARRQYPDEYSCTYEGHTLDLGPHIVVGSAASAELCARIYVHASDGTSGLERGLIVGYIGRHLPGAG